jgi:CDP-diacylglycerol--serine O-phosphatidyltransferase
MLIIHFNENEKSLGRWNYFIAGVLVFLSAMMVSTVKYPTFKTLGLRSTSTFLKAILAALFIGIILVFRDKVLYYVLPAFFTLYLIYGFIRPRISRRVRHEIEEEDDDDLEDLSLPK